MKKANKFLFILVLFCMFLVGCSITIQKVKIQTANNTEILIGETLQVKVSVLPSVQGQKVWTSSDEGCLMSLGNGTFMAMSEGTVKVTCTVGEYSDSINIIIVSSKLSVILSANKDKIEVGQTLELTATPSEETTEEISYVITDGFDYAKLDGNILIGVKKGQVTVQAYVGITASNTLTIQILSDGSLEEIMLKTSKNNILRGESIELTIETVPTGYESQVVVSAIDGDYYTELSGNTVTGYSVGATKFAASLNGITSNEITITVVDDGIEPTSILLTVTPSELTVGETASLNVTITPENAKSNYEYVIVEGNQYCEISDNTLNALAEGTVKVGCKIGNVTSNVVEVTIKGVSDPYVDMSYSDFYNNYTPAKDNLDAYYRSLHGFMSGSIADQNQAPTLAKNQPTSNGKLTRNTSSIFSDFGNTYSIVDENGTVVNKIHRDGAYVSLEEVAAYVLAFGNVPQNYSESKNADPSYSIWKQYLRLNHSYFSGDTSSYPYEPVLPNIRGCGGQLYYYELDLGTTGTDCDSSYQALPYNDGSKIVRGAARIVYTRYNGNKESFSDINDKYVFYTYNHYNDFQEYLNYQGGWGKIFGNVTGGGEISSKVNYNPTDYIQTSRADFTTLSKSKRIIMNNLNENNYIITLNDLL